MAINKKKKDDKNILNRGADKLKGVRTKVKGNGQSGAGKVSGVAALFMLEYILRGLNGLVVDNAIMRKTADAFGNMTVGKVKSGRRQGKDKKFSSFVKRNPNFSAHIVYYMLLLGIIGGGTVYIKSDDSQENTTEKKIDISKKLKPQSDDFIDRCIALENLTSIAIIYSETYREIPKVQYRENVWTHGYGMTWSRNKNGHMRIRDYEKDTKDHRAHKPQEHRTKDEDLEETQQFLIDHVYPEIKRNMKRELTFGEFLGLCVAGYQLEGHIKTICENLNAAKTTQQIADAFITPTMYSYAGTPKRRWVCAMLAIGAITLNDVLDADMDNFYDPDQNTFIRNKHFVHDVNTIQYVLNLKRKKSTRAELMETQDGKLAISELGRGVVKARVIELDNGAEEQKISKSMGKLIKAQEKFDSGDFSAAAKLFERAIADDPDNMEAYSSLALTYKKLGDKTKSIEYYEKSCDVVKDCAARMNANKTLLMDHDVKAAAYFNAGLAREAMADIYAGQGKKDLAKQNYILARQNFQTAKTNCQMGGASEQRINAYDSAIKRVANAVKSKELAFAAGAKKVENRVHSADLVANEIINKKQNA